MCTAENTAAGVQASHSAFISLPSADLAVLLTVATLMKINLYVNGQKHDTPGWLTIE